MEAEVRVTANVICLVGSFICFRLATFGVESKLINVVALGLALFVLSMIIR